MTIPDIILRAEISQYLATIAIKRGGLFGKGTPSYLPSLLYQVRKSVYRVFILDPTNDDLIGNANYLYALCGIFGVRASYLINPGGSIPVPVSNPAYSYPIQGIYTATTDGETILDLGLPAGAIVVWAEKSTSPLSPVNWSWVYPNLNLLNGTAMSPFEELSYLYVVPVT